MHPRTADSQAVFTAVRAGLDLSDLIQMRASSSHFISNQVLRPVNEGDPYVVFTTWKSREEFLNRVRSDEFVKGHAQSGTLPEDAYPRANVLEMHEVVQDSTRPDLEAEPKGGPFRMD
jgi:heme oxygenase (mycobilin-producing)